MSANGIAEYVITLDSRAAADACVRDMNQLNDGYEYFVQLTLANGQSTVFRKPRS